MSRLKNYSVTRITKPVCKFLQHEKAGGIVLGISVILALAIANSPWSEHYHHFLSNQFGFVFQGKTFLEYDIHHWINDGLMAVFFFVVGLELKREMKTGALSQPRNAILPIVAAVGGMVVPAIIYFSMNSSGEATRGWGIPMATDIAFALGVLSLLGNKIPFTLKVFLTALAIVDDLGAVIVIALFYTADISLTYLLVGMLFIMIMYLGNKTGVRSMMFYAILGIGGAWVCFLLSGVHATVAAVLAAFTIPIDVKVSQSSFIKKMQGYLEQLKHDAGAQGSPTLTNEQMHIMEEVKKDTDHAIPPLQKMEHALQPYVSFIIIPIFALANAGVSVLDIDPEQVFGNNIAWGVALGLFVGKVVGVVGLTLLLVKLKVAALPEGMHSRNLLGMGFLAAIGFTMSLFITSLAFNNHELFQTQAKLGIFAASIIGGVVGYMILNGSSKKTKLA